MARPTIVRAPSDQDSFNAVRDWMESNAPQGFPLHELKNSKVRIRRYRTYEGVSYVVVVVAVETWKSLRFILFMSGGYILVQGYGRKCAVNPPPVAFLGQPQGKDTCPICKQRRPLCQEYNSNATPRGKNMRCQECFYIPSIDVSPIVKPSLSTVDFLFLQPREPYRQREGSFMYKCIKKAPSKAF